MLSSTSRVARNNAKVILPQSIDLNSSNIVAEIRRYNSIPILPRSTSDCPSGVCIFEFAEYWKKPAGFEDFAQRFALNITIVSLVDVRFKCFSDLVDLVGCFPFVEKLRVWNCHWDDDNLELWDGCRLKRNAPSNCPCNGPQMPVGVRLFTASVPQATCPVPLARWFNHGSSTRHPLRTEWKMYFRMSDNRAAAATVESLRVLGQDLNILVLVSVSGPDSGSELVVSPSLSFNTKLEEVILPNIVPGHCPSRYISEIFLSVRSTTLKIFRVGLCPGSKSLCPWERIDWVDFNRVLVRMAHWKVDVYLSLHKESSPEILETLKATLLRRAPSLLNSLYWRDAKQ